MMADPPPPGSCAMPSTWNGGGGGGGGGPAGVHSRWRVRDERFPLQHVRVCRLAFGTRRGCARCIVGNRLGRRWRWDQVVRRPRRGRLYGERAHERDGERERGAGKAG